MKLITEVTIPEYPFRLDHETPILMMGSCFAENIGRLLEKYLFHVCINPFGVTYNPLSVKAGLEALLFREKYTADDLDLYNGLWFSFDHYTGFSGPDRDKTLNGINLSFMKAKEMLRKARYLVLTWGTAWVFTNNTTGKVVCNCHKIPASRFTRRRLSASEITGAYEPLLQSLFELNKDLKILLTVSPVRHWKDGAHGNQLSKSTLLLAQESLEQLYPERLYYFPSYEIVMDELRDYRFYAEDLLHPSEVATRYIWEKFEQALLGKESRQINRDLDPLLKMSAHRPMAMEAEAHLETANRLKEKLRLLKEKYPQLQWEIYREKDVFTD